MREEEYKRLRNYVKHGRQGYTEAALAMIDNLLDEIDCELLSVGEQSCLVFAARYAHTRNTGAANMVVSTALANWSRLIPETQAQLKREAENETTCNQDDWRRLVDI